MFGYPFQDYIPKNYRLTLEKFALQIVERGGGEFDLKINFKILRGNFSEQSNTCLGIQ